MKGIVAALAALAFCTAAASAQAADAPAKPAAKPRAAATADAGKAKPHYYVMKCKTDACRTKHPTGKYYVPIKKKG